MNLTEDRVKSILSDVIPSINEDESVMEYFLSMLVDNPEVTSTSYLSENIAPFIESYGLIHDNTSADVICNKLCEKFKELMVGAVSSVVSDDSPKLLDKAIILSEVVKNQLSATEQETTDTLWGFQKIRAKRNETFEATEAASSRYERKAAKEQKKFLDSLDSQENNGDKSAFIMDHSNEGDDEGNGQISAMVLPDLTGKSREKDIHVSNFNVTFGGQILLEGADLRIVYGRRYGLVVRNGIGKTTLLSHMASFDIEGFPTHHRVLHVKQEVYSSGKSVLQAVLDSDVERNQLIEKEKKLVEEQQSSDNATRLQEVNVELTEVYERMEYIGAQTAEGRAAQILSGLQFTEEMQNASTESLSGGWRMRVSLASALFIEPDLLMLDE